MTKGTGHEVRSPVANADPLAKRGCLSLRANVTLLKLPSHSCKYFRVAIAWLHRRSLRCFPYRSSIEPLVPRRKGGGLGFVSEMQKQQLVFA